MMAKKKRQFAVEMPYFKLVYEDLRDGDTEGKYTTLEKAKAALIHCLPHYRYKDKKPIITWEDKADHSTAIINGEKSRYMIWYKVFRLE